MRDYLIVQEKAHDRPHLLLVLEALAPVDGVIPGKRKLSIAMDTSKIYSAPREKVASLFVVAS